MGELLFTWEPSSLYREVNRESSVKVGFGSGPLLPTVSALSFPQQALVTTAETSASLTQLES